VLEIRILAGRAFTDHDAAADASVIIDEVFVNRHFPGVDPIGRIIQLPAAEGEYRDLQVIGVVSSVKHQSLEEEEGLPTFYRLATAPMIPSLVVRTGLQAENLAREVPGMVKRVMPGAEVAFNRPLVEAIAGTLTSRRALVEAVGLFAVLTVALAALGLYAVLSFAVRRRTSEIGVRMALGANRPRILRMVMGQGGAMIAAGVASGLAAGIPLARLLADRLFRLTPGDPLTWTLTATVVALAALFACWWPARRATRVPPRVALQSD
jgi:putative ABC transport system permease protein